MMGVFAVTSFVAGSLYDRVGVRLIVGTGAACLGIGIFVLSFIDADSSYASLVPGMVVLGIGVGLFYSSITTAAITALDPSRSSSAGGIVYMCQIAGGAIGLGLNTAIVASAPSLAEASAEPSGWTPPWPSRASWWRSGSSASAAPRSTAACCGGTSAPIPDGQEVS